MLKNNYYLGNFVSQISRVGIQASYLEMVTDEISQGRKLLESVAAKTKTPDQRTRVNLILRAFEYYEASAISYAHNLF